MPMKSFFENVRKPQNSLGGNMILWMMNTGHNRMAMWGLSHIEIAPTANVLDVGCGGGRNISNLLHRATDGKVYGVDYAPASVEKSKKVNQTMIAAGKAEVICASVSSLPFEEGKFDIVTAFETIYFWPDLINDFKEVGRILKKGGTFFICNEMFKPKDAEMWIKMLDLKVYTKEELSSALSDAGFSDVCCHIHKNGRWLCASAKKP